MHGCICQINSPMFRLLAMSQRGEGQKHALALKRRPLTRPRRRSNNRGPNKRQAAKFPSSRQRGSHRTPLQKSIVKSRNPPPKSSPTVHEKINRILRLKPIRKIRRKSSSDSFSRNVFMSVSIDDRLHYFTSVRIYGAPQCCINVSFDARV